MASRSISAILWTLVSVNFFTLIVGGLITWLGYTIPVRLKQVGLLPELVIVAGSASLVVACIGLCALNYSSPNTLNIYACSCAVFILMLVLGIPEGWYKSTHFVRGTLLLDMIYFSLLFILLLLFVFAITLAQYMRRKERQIERSTSSGIQQASSSLIMPQADHQLVGSLLPARVANGAGCTCVMITPPLDDHDNSNNQNMPSRRRSQTQRGPSIMDRWLSRLKPAQLPPRAGPLATQQRAQLTTDPLLDTHLTRNADHLHLSVMETHQRSSSSVYSSNNNHNHHQHHHHHRRHLRHHQHPYQSAKRPTNNYHRSAAAAAAITCSCGQLPLPELINPTMARPGRQGDSSTLPALVSRGIYRQHDRWDPPEPNDLCRSTSNLCASDEMLADWPADLGYHQADPDRSDGGPPSQYDSALNDDWRPNKQPVQLKRSSSIRHDPVKHQNRHLSSNPSNSADLRCNCSPSSILHHHHQQSPYTLPMINSSLSVYSISGTAGYPDGGAARRPVVASYQVAQKALSSSSGRFTGTTTNTSTSVA